VSPFAFYAALWLTAGTTIVLGREALAADDSGAPNATLAAPEPEPPAPIAWGLRFTASAGLAYLPEDPTGGGVALRVGLDGEYWLSKNIGIGAQLGFQALQAVDFCFDEETCNSASASRLSVAPTLTLRGNNATIPTAHGYPLVSLALGYSWGHTEASTSCDPDPTDQYPTCQSGDEISDTSGPYGSLTAAWIFHPGQQPGPGAFALGPLVRVDWFSLYDPTSSSFGTDTFGWTFTTGITMGFDVASP
jgi:hypothetical protein